MTQLPDSGSRREFSTGSVRDEVDGKGSFHLLSPFALRAYAKRMQDGMTKYGARNWEKGQPVMNFLDSALRHINDYMADCATGEEAQEDHLGAALWNVASAIHTVAMIERGLLPKELDDRPEPPMTATQIISLTEGGITPCSSRRVPRMDPEDLTEENYSKHLRVAIKQPISPCTRHLSSPEEITEQLDKELGKF